MQTGKTHEKVMSMEKRVSVLFSAIYFCSFYMLLFLADGG